MSVAEHARAAAKAGGWAASDVTLCALPLTGVFAYIPAMAAIASRGVCLLEPVFQPETIIADMARFGVTHVVGGDDIVGRLVEAWKAAPRDLERWRRLLMADFNGKSLELAAWAEQQFRVEGQWRLRVVRAFRPDVGSGPSTQRPQRRSARGWISGLVTHRRSLRGPRHRTDQRGRFAGELQFRGPNVVDAYLGHPELRAMQMTPDGWFRSGDLGVVNEDGSFQYVCRMGRIALRLKGFLVEPAEIEARLAAHPAVQIAKVVGLRLADGGARRRQWLRGTRGSSSHHVRSIAQLVRRATGPTQGPADGPHHRRHADDVRRQRDEDQECRAAALGAAA